MACYYIQYIVCTYHFNMLYHHQYMKITSTNVVTENLNASYRGWGKTVPDRLAPTLGHRLASDAHYLKEGSFVCKKYVMWFN